MFANLAEKKVELPSLFFSILDTFHRFRFLALRTKWVSLRFQRRKSIDTINRLTIEKVLIMKTTVRAATVLTRNPVIILWKQRLNASKLLSRLQRQQKGAGNSLLSWRRKVTTILPILEPTFGLPQVSHHFDHWIRVDVLRVKGILDCYTSGVDCSLTFCQLTWAHSRYHLGVWPFRNFC